MSRHLNYSRYVLYAECAVAFRYRVDRQKSIDVLKAFLDKKDTKLQQERAWLVETKVDCVLSDAAFLGWCVATLFPVQSSSLYLPWTGLRFIV